ncbi:hypothetical protein CPIN18021_0292 [Campylobacter pinnipediorum subsp. caledonicus]|uniref:DUF285 domain protein n=1 Tax=Campylobacter pinnipediorum subsp. caledonicus TaxID=1874362 RepID=A0A1S6U630_9BACT|nr:BspA family leucine-rich repeat surface protein [Campylobacter pinnipediorum]AQW87139.1 hypothetical protein CPIN18021_0292 [Campylobacter pinnipediorum subsp. caledonicus]
MISMHELKLADETLEALKFLLTQTTELESAIKTINLTEIKGINESITQAKDRVETIEQGINEVKNTFENEKGDFDSKYSLFNEFHNTLDTLKSTLESLKQSALTAERNAISKADESKRYANDIKQKHDEITNATNDFRKNAEKVNQTLTSVDSAKRHIDLKTDELRAYTDDKHTKFTQIEKHLENIQQEKSDEVLQIVKSAKAETNELKEQIQDFMQNVNSANDELDQKKAELKELGSSLSEIKEQINQVISGGVINDNVVSQTQTYSSNKIEQKLADINVDEKLTNLINDNSSAINKVYSSNKINELLGDVYTKAQSDGKYALSSALANYLTTVNANNTYATKNELNSVRSAIPSTSGFLTQSSADSRYIRSENANYTTVTDNLASSSPKEALSANQGKVLKELIDKKIDKTSAEFLYLKKAGQTAFDKREQTSLSADLRQSNNFVITPSTKETLSLNNAIAGQTGMIVVMDGSKISGFGSMCKFKVVPKNLYGYELFIYFAVSPTDIKMSHITVNNSNSVESKVQRFKGTYFPLTHTTKDPVYPKYVERGGTPYTFKPNDGLYFSKPPTSFKYLFKNDSNANNSLYFNDPDISLWDTTQITNMADMFYGCKKFNQSLNNLNTENVTDMNSMFWDCYEFNQTLEHFKTDKVIDMSFMFHDCKKFNKNITNWSVGRVAIYQYFAQGSALSKSNVPSKFRNKNANTAWR